jgi:flotillin
MLVFLASRYKKCPSDKLLVVYGKTSGGSAQVYHGGGAFIWPIIQDYAFLDLEPMSINIPLEGALSKQNIRVNVPSTFTVAISTEDNIRKNAAERLLGQSQESQKDLVRNIILGQLRLVIATMDIEEINTNRDKFLQSISANIEAELSKVGLHLINSNIQDIHDESGYIQALGKEAAAQAINDAKITVAEKNRDGDIGESSANKERAIATSKLRSDAEIGEANAATAAAIGKSDAESRARSKSAEYNAQAVEGENKAAVHIAQTTSERMVAEAEASKLADIAQNVAKAETKERTYLAEQKAEKGRAERDKMTLYANTVVPAEIQKNKAIVEAEAEAEQIMKIAKADADAKLMQKDAEAKGIEAVFKGQADGFKELVKAAGSPELAIQMMITEQLPELMRIQVDAIKNLKIDKVVVWDGMGGKSGNSTTGDWVQGLLKSLPAYDELYKMTGNSLPTMLNVSKSGEDKTGEEQVTEEQ